MNIMKKIFYFLVVSLLLSSCGVFEGTGLKGNSLKRKGNNKAGIIRMPQYTNCDSVGKNCKDQGTFMWSYYDATKRGSMMYLDPQGRVRVLAENPPDAAIQSITNITANANVDGKVDASLAFSTAQSIAELGKRTAGVNMLRDALYRLNELYYATKDEKADILDKLLSNKNDIDNFIKLQKTNLDFKSLTKTTISEDSITSIFKKIIDNAKDINMEEAKASVLIEASKSKSSIEKYKKEIAQLKYKKDVFEKIKDSLTKKELKKYLDELLNLEK